MGGSLIAWGGQAPSRGYAGTLRWDQPTGRLLTENRMFDWLAEFVPARRA